MKTIAINLYGGPGAGKTTLAPRLFSELNIGKPFGEAVFVQEYAKELVYAKRFDLLSDQIHVTTEQCRRMDIYAGVVGAVVTDSPVHLGLVYSPDHQKDKVRDLIQQSSEQFFNVNILLRRIDGRYEQNGRIESKSEAEDKDLEIADLLVSSRMPFVIIQNEYDIATAIKHISETVYDEVNKCGLFAAPTKESASMELYSKKR